MQTTQIQETGQNAAAENAELRRELAAAIETRRAADTRAKLARDVASKAKVALEAATAKVAELAARAEREEAFVLERHGRAIAEALRGGAEPPGLGPLPVADANALQRSRGEVSALASAYGELKAESETAAAVANAAGAEVRALVDAALEAEAKRLGAEWIAAAALSWQLADKMAGLIQFMERRAGTPQLREWQAEIRKQLDRRASACARDPMLMEVHNWNAHLDKLTADQERVWEEFARQLERGGDGEAGSA